MMFTQNQGQELIDNTNHEWTTINSVNGRKFTSKTDSSKYIFLPVGGYWNDTSHNHAGSYGDYWSAMLYSSVYAWNMNFYSIRLHMSELANRYLGFSIRDIRPLEW